MNHFHASLFFSLWMIIAASPLGAVRTEKFSNDTLSDFSEGRAYGVAITADGFLKIGSEVTRWSSLPASILWTSVRDSNGDIYVSAGNDGQVFKVGHNGKALEFLDVDELQIQALAIDHAGNLYAGSMPDGKVYRVTEDGKSSVFFDPKEKYIWALQFDEKGNLFVATGDKGRLYKVSPSGKGSLFYDSDEMHLRTLLMDHQKRLWVGSEESGLVYRFDRTGGAQSTPFVAYDSQFREIKAMVASPDGSIFVAAMGDGKSVSTSQPTGSMASVASSLLSLATVSIAGEGGPKVEEVSFTTGVSEKPASGAGEIIRLLADGNIERWWTDSEDVYTLLIPQTGVVWAGTGKNGKLIELTGPDQFSILGQLQAKTITSLMANGKDGWLATTSNTGAIWKLSSVRGRKGTFESKVLDTHFSSRWGSLDFRLMTDAVKTGFFTRSGNTTEPGKVWNDWAPLDAENHIKSPSARFIQYKAVLEASARLEINEPVIDSVNLYYQTRNQSPKITRISLSQPNVELVKMPRSEFAMPIMSSSSSYAAQTRGAKTGGVEPFEDPFASLLRMPMLQQVKKPGWRSVSWQAADPNNDELRYDVSYRTAGSKNWKLLKQQLTDQFFAWDAATWPDGEYYIRVSATDLPSNQSGDARVDEMDGDVFTVDNTAPTIESDVSDKTIKKGALPIKISDTTSIVDEAEFSLDGADWRPLLPVNGLYDSKANTFMISIDQLKPGEHYVVIRASDSANNVASQTLRFRK